MSVLTRFQAKVTQPKAHAGSSSTSPRSSSSELSQQPSLEGGFLCSNGVFEDDPSTLSVGNERPLAVRTSRADCLTSLVLIGENQFVSNTTTESILPLILNLITFTASFKTISTYQ